MLARVAERVFWFARYMERAENTARLLNVYSNLLLDLPRGTRIGWKSLIDIIGNGDQFYESYRDTNEANVTKFLLTDARNPSSIYSTILLARENARTTREILPSEVWEKTNELYLRAEDSIGRRLSRTSQNDLLRGVITQLQMLMGKMSGTMSQNHAYNFVRLGRYLERADMTSRIVDAGTGSFITGSRIGSEKMGESVEPFDERPYENILWMNVLNSLSAYQMYRQYSFDRVSGPDVVTFLLKDPYFPRSVTHCLDEMAHDLTKLPRGDAVMRVVTMAQRHIGNLEFDDISKDDLHELVDVLQVEFASIYDAVSATWFKPVIEFTE